MKPITKPVWRRGLVILAALATLSACAAPAPSAEVNDPLEGTNRNIHAFNKGLDRAALRPASQAYGTVVPGPVRQGVSNFADNLSLPSAIINNALQGDLEAVGLNSGRFLVNSTFGVLGIFDPATGLGVTKEGSDFGETLHVWGVGEGAYVELPFLGPSTSRDAVGSVVDVVLNPVSQVLSTPEINYVRAGNAGDVLGSRFRFSDTVDSILYDSADSYAQSRLIYLQNRRFELGQEPAETSIDIEGDLYDDLYFE